MATEPEDSKTWAFHMMRRFGIDPASNSTSHTRDDSLSSYRECAMAATALHSGERPPSNQSLLRTSYCNVCNLQFCDNCWDLQPTHMFGTLGVTGVPHEKTDPDVAEIVRATLEVTTSDDQQQELHAEDEDTTWFGMVEVNGEPTFRDYGRYSDLMASFPKLQEERCCPGLVSFVGPTGAGKSTLVKLLIELRSRKGDKCETPVVGRVDDGLSPTSGDVHLYPDPNSFDTNRPLLYADCEGIQGGDRLPKAAKARKRLAKAAHKAQRHAVFRNVRHAADRTLKWAKGDDEKKRREFAVTNLYPRLLYTFTDVVVFVLKSQQSIEKIIVQLLDWAKLVAETSSNQPTLPHAIIALNASGNKIDPSRWDIAASTAWLMREVQPALTENLDLQRYVRLWKKKGLEITSVETLLLRYYSSFKVIHIPENGRPELIRAQVAKLYDEISRATEESHEHKKSQRMLLSSSDLQSYLSYAFDWFSNVLDKPFDFIQASFSNSSIPLDFRGNITKLALSVLYANQWTYGTKFMVKPLFEGLSYLVGSCIMLDSARHKYHGLALDIFPLYEQPIEDALEEFCSRGWPCEWIHPKKRTRCINMKNGHTKGHQLKSGKVYNGLYQSSFSSATYRETFRANVFYAFEENMKRLQEDDRRLRQDGLPEERVAASIHKRTTLEHFYAKLRGPYDALFSNTSCLVCLMNTPEHRLPCGHILCAPCLHAYGNAKSDILIEIESCPLPHSRVKWDKPWPVSIKPAHAGVRVLCLDGGGVRGIVELEILKLIQDKLPPLIPIRSFFDLIVGTSTGGLVALGLVAKVWTVETCTNNFNGLCGEAFQRRTGGNWGAIGDALNAYNHSRYKTKPLEQSLKKAYCSLVGKEYMFGGTSTLEYPSIKVAVVTTTIGGDPAVVSNYNRAATENLTYQFVRPDHPRHELEVWEAARATSAAPNYFRSYHHELTNQVYEDGGLYHNNPIFIADSERKLIWPEFADGPPDILISIGTGHNPRRLTEPTTPKQVVNPPRRGLISHFKTFKRIAQDHVAVSLNSERTWLSWLQTLPNQQEYKKRFVRLNVACSKDPPQLDDVQSMPQLRQYVQEQYALNRAIEDIAHHLVSSSFYVVPAASSTGPEEIRCRLAPGEIQALGHWLSRFPTQTHRPYFIIRMPHDNTSARKIPLTDSLLSAMTKSGEFSLHFNAGVSPKTILEILFCLDDRETRREHLISGFPRIIEEDRVPGNRKRSQPSPGQPSSPVQPRSKTPILPLGTYSRPSRLEDWDPLQGNDSLLTRARRRRDFFVTQTANAPVYYDSNGEVVYEMEDTSMVHEMADTSIRSADSGQESDSDEDSTA